MPNSAGEEEVLPTEGRGKRKRERERGEGREIRLSVSLERSFRKSKGQWLEQTSAGGWLTQVLHEEPKSGPEPQHWACSSRDSLGLTHSLQGTKARRCPHLH